MTETAPSVEYKKVPEPHPPADRPTGRADGESDSVLARVYEAEFDFVCRSLYRLGVPHQDIEDIAHEVFLTFLHRLADYDATRPVRPWLFGIALRVSARHRQRSTRRQELANAMRSNSDGVPREDAAAQQLVVQALHAVELDQRGVLIMHDIEGLSMPEIAEALSIPLNTGYSRLRLARERLTREVRRIAAREGGAR